MIFEHIFTILIIVNGINSSPILGNTGKTHVARAVPDPTLVEHDGGRLYTGQEAHSGTISKAELNSKSEEFYHKVAAVRVPKDTATSDNDGFVVAAHKHGDAVYYSSTMNVKAPGRGLLQPKAFVETAEAANNELKNKGSQDIQPMEKKFQGQVKAGRTSYAHRTQPPQTVVADPRQNFAKCAEAGTCRQVEQQHGSVVDMVGDKISAFGHHGLPGGGETTSHVASCTTSNHRQFNCNGVGEIKGLDDVNRPGRPDSSIGNSPKPLAPIKTSQPPSPGIGPSSRPQSPGTPPQRTPPQRPPPVPQSPGSGQKHYMLPTAASRNKQKNPDIKGKGRIGRRTLVRRDYLVEDIIPFLDFIYEI